MATVTSDREDGLTGSADLGGLDVGDRCPVRILGAINVSPESFYKGSVAAKENVLRERAEAMAAEGADMLDVGAMSTAPYLDTEISETEEIRRLTWAVGILRSATTLPISVDTKRSRAALAALDSGATVINDISGFQHDPAMAGVAARQARGAILMASESVPGAREPVATVRALLQKSLGLAEAAGVSRERIILDPGIGFFRRAAVSWEVWDCEVLRRLADLRALGRPILIGLSRKSFIGKILGRPDPDDRLAGSLAATVIAILNGAHVVRTHDVAATRDAIRIAEALKPR